MNAYEIIYRKREGKELSPEEVSFIIEGYLEGRIPDYQVSAFLMAVFFRGMGEEELAGLTRVMLNSGEQVDLGDMPGPTVDKHSTGGVGDGVSLTLAALAASLGAVVPMMSGRGLGHTGGTLDKLESIPGYRVNLSSGEFIKVLRKTGAAIIGQTDKIAPADRKLYALRDVTATVDSIPLITASIMSKKLAEGASSLVLDVKTGTGAFMKSIGDARKLAGSMIATGRAHGRNISAVISDMNRPLGEAVGNAIEVEEAVELMSGGGVQDIRELIICLAGEMLCLSGIEKTPETARSKARENLSNGKALEKFGEMVEAQGGDRRICEDPKDILPQPAMVAEVEAPETGWITAMDTRRIGVCALSLGAGRKSVDDRIDYSAGIRVLKKTGDKVSRGEVIAILYTSSLEDLLPVKSDYLSTLNISGDEPEAQEIIHEVIR